MLDQAVYDLAELRYRPQSGVDGATLVAAVNTARLGLGGPPGPILHTLQALGPSHMRIRGDLAVQALIAAYRIRAIPWYAGLANDLADAFDRITANEVLSISNLINVQGFANPEALRTSIRAGVFNARVGAIGLASGAFALFSAEIEASAKAELIKAAAESAESGERDTTRKPEINSLWHWIAPMMVGLFIGVVCWAINDPGVWTKTVGIAGVSVGLAWTLTTCPWIKPGAWRIAAAGCVIVLIFPALLWRVFDSDKSPLVYLNTTMISVPDPEANIIGLPNDGHLNQLIETNLVTPAGYRVAPIRAALRVNVTNDETTAWKDYAITLKVHYEMRPYLPTNRDWSKLQNIEQDVTLRNCGSPFACHEPIVPGRPSTLVFVNHSSSYAAIEFPESAQVTLIGEDRPRNAVVHLSGDTMLPLAAQALPPYPEPTHARAQR